MYKNLNWASGVKNRIISLLWKWKTLNKKNIISCCTRHDLREVLMSLYFVNNSLMYLRKNITKYLENYTRNYPRPPSGARGTFILIINFKHHQTKFALRFNSEQVKLTVGSFSNSSSWSHDTGSCTQGRSRENREVWGIPVKFPRALPLAPGK